MASAIPSSGIGSVNRHQEQTWVPSDRPGCSQPPPIAVHNVHTVQLSHVGWDRGCKMSELASTAARHYGLNQQNCFVSYFNPKLAQSRRLMGSFEQNNLYGVKLCVRIWCQAVLKEEVATALVAAWSEQPGDAADEAEKVVESATTWKALLSAKVEAEEGITKLKVVGDKVKVKVVVAKANGKHEHVERSLGAVGVRNGALAKCVNQGVDMTEEDMLEWMNMIRRLGFGHSGIVTLVGKDASVLYAKGPDVELLWEHLRDEFGIERATVVCMCLQWPSLLLCSVDHVKEVTEYLISVGICREDLPVVLAQRPQLLGHSIERIQQSVHCLLEAGVLPEDLARILKKVPELFSDMTQKNLKPKLEFLLNAGLGAGALGKAVARRPNILNYSLDSMKATTLYLQSLMRARDVSKLVKRYAEVLVLDPQRKMYPIVKYLLTLGVQPDNLGKVILRRPQLLGYTIPGLQPTVQYLLLLGVKPDMLGKVITTSPQVLTLNVEEKLKPVVEFFRSIGLNKERDMEMLLVRNAQILCCSIDKNLRPKFAFFKGLGLNESAIANMIVLFPSMLGQSIDGSLGPKYEYLVNEMHRSIDEVVDFPQYFGYSLENRIKPRHEKLKEKAIVTSLASMLACVDSDFHTRYLSGQAPSRAPYRTKTKIPRCHSRFL